MVVQAPRARVSGGGVASKSRQIKRRPKTKRPSAEPSANTVAVPDGSDERETRAYLIAQEIKFAKLFAGNDTKLSEKQLKRLKHWLTIRAGSSFPFDHNNFMRLWKGLFYSMWMSDKPLPQEQLAERIAQLVHAFRERPAVAVQFFGAHLATMSAEWFGIDQWRLDKFMMLVRRCARQMLRLVHAAGWPLDLLAALNEQIAQTVLRSAASVGFFMHFTELWLEEVAKVTQGELPAAAVTALVQPFGAYLARPRDSKLCQHVVKHVFNWLLFQSELGREYQERFEAWKSVGFAGNTIEAMERAPEAEDDEGDEGAEDSDDGESDADGKESTANGADGSGDDDDEQEEEGDREVHLDPRAGRVDVVMPEILFEPEAIIAQLEAEKLKSYTNVKSRQQVTRVINNYAAFAGGRFPLGIQQIRLKSDNIELPSIDDKVDEMLQFERRLHKSDAELKSLSKRNRRKMLAGRPVSAEALEAAKRRRATKNRDRVASAEYLEELRRERRLKRAAEGHHVHDGNGCCGGHESVPRKRRSITPAEKKKIKQWAEEDLPAVVVTPATPVGKADAAVEASPSQPPSLKSPKQSKAARKSLQIAAAEELKTPPPPTTTASNGVVPAADPWLEPLQEGEVEFSTPSRKKKLLQINAAVAAAEQSPAATPLSTPELPKSAAKRVINPAAFLLGRTPQTPQQQQLTPGGRRKSVVIALENNRSQKKADYERQIKSSPTPYDGSRVPAKGALKPNLMPTPINWCHSSLQRKE